MTRGRPPKPIEVKRRNGNPGKRPLPEGSPVVLLPSAHGIPALPRAVELGDAGTALWDAIWLAGAVWISPTTDIHVVVETCRLVDDLAIARDKHRLTRDARDARVVALCSKSVTEALASLGFNPTARSRLGVAEVKARSKLEELRERRIDRGRPS